MEYRYRLRERDGLCAEPKKYNEKDDNNDDNSLPLPWLRTILVCSLPGQGESVWKQMRYYSILKNAMCSESPSSPSSDLFGVNLGF